jgi:hypothetical protein
MEAAMKIGLTSDNHEAELIRLRVSQSGKRMLDLEDYGTQFMTYATFSSKLKRISGLIPLLSRALAAQYP